LSKMDNRKQFCPNHELNPRYLRDWWESKPLSHENFLDKLSFALAHVMNETQGIKNVITNACRSADVLYEPCDQIFRFLMISCWESLLINEKKLPLFQERRGNIDR
jgi:hypothetical protein